MSPPVRRANSDDVEGICRVGREAWPATYSFAGHEYIEHGLATWWSAEAVERSLATTSTFVAVHEGEVVGTGNVDLRPVVPVIWKLYVDPSHQGGGVGGALLNALVHEVPLERRTVAIEFLEGNERAAAIYARRGFVEVRRDPADRPDWPCQVWAELALSPP